MKEEKRLSGRLTLALAALLCLLFGLSLLLFLPGAGAAPYGSRRPLPARL